MGDFADGASLELALRGTRPAQELQRGLEGIAPSTRRSQRGAGRGARGPLTLTGITDPAEDCVAVGPLTKGAIQQRLTQGGGSSP